MCALDQLSQPPAFGLIGFLRLRVTILPIDVAVCRLAAAKLTSTRVDLASDGEPSLWSHGGAFFARTLAWRQNTELRITSGTNTSTMAETRSRK